MQNEETGFAALRAPVIPRSTFFLLPLIFKSVFICG
jgi:hypothetical protein